MAPAAAGYSGTPLPAKLGLKDGMVAAFIALPPELDELATAVDFASVDRLAAWSAISGNRQKYDAVHAFTRQRAEIEDHLGDVEAAIKRDGMVWVSWPKKASKVPTDVTEDVIRAGALKRDLVDVKVAAVNEVWSGLKLVIRKERRAQQSGDQPGPGTGSPNAAYWQKYAVSLRIAENGRFRCACCNDLAFGEAGGYEICQRCGWEDDHRGEKELSKRRLF